MAERTQTIKVFNKRNPEFAATYRKVSKVSIATEAGRKLAVIEMPSGTATFPIDEWVILHKGWTEYEF